MLFIYYFTRDFQKIQMNLGSMSNPGHGKNHAPDFNSIYKKTNIQ